jgi:PKD repeat protein
LLTKKQGLTLVVGLFIGMLLCNAVSAVSFDNPTNQTIKSNTNSSTLLISLNKAQNNLKQAHVKTTDITNVNYGNYFYQNGGLKKGVIKSGDILRLHGKFYKKDFIINIPINLVGYSSKIYNGTIKITDTGSGTNISNIFIKNDDRMGIVINESNNNILKNNTIFTFGNSESIGIYLKDSKRNKLINNIIGASGNYITYGILCYESYNNEIRYNKLKVTGTSHSLGYTASIKVADIGEIEEIFPTYGMILLFSSGNKILNNNVQLNSAFKTTTTPSSNCMNSMVGIDIYYDSHNNQVKNNKIQVSGKNPYSYGFGVLGAMGGSMTTSALNNIFSCNNVMVNGTYFATGFIAGLNSINTTLRNNKITVSSLRYGYGVTLEGSQKNKITGNTLNTTSSANYVLELFSSNGNIIEANKMVSKGNYNYGVAAYMSSNNNIRTNKIWNVAIHDKPFYSYYHDDVIPWGNAGIYLMANSRNNTIYFNEINVSGTYAVNATGTVGTIIKNNYLSSNNKKGNYASLPGMNGIVINNYGMIIQTDFKVNNAKGISPLTLKFFDKSKAKTTTWKWYFGDGTTSSQQNPTHTYAKKGVYDVNLVVTNTTALGQILKRGYITVIETNEPPKFVLLTNKVVKCTKTLKFNVTGTDPNFESLKYSANNLPKGSKFNVNNGLFVWKPSKNQVGTYYITFKLSNGILSSSKTINIVVKCSDVIVSKNHAPTGNFSTSLFKNSHKHSSSTKLSEDTVSMQKTGSPLNYLVMAVLLLIGGFSFCVKT